MGRGLIKALFVFLVLGFSLTIFSSTSFAAAATCYWVGASSGNWGNAASWSSSSGGAGSTCDGGVAPGSDDIATFTSANTNNPNLNASVNVKGIDIRSGYTGTITQPISTSITVGTSGWQQADGVFSGHTSGTVSIGGTSAISGGTFTPAATTSFTGGTGLTISGGTITTGKTITTTKSITISGSPVLTGAIITLNGGATTSQTITCSGSLNSSTNINPTINISGGANSQTTTLGNGCTLYQNAISTSGSIIINGIMDQSGAWSSNDVTINGTLTRSANNTMAINGTFSNTGTLTQAANTTITVKDDYSNAGTISNLDSTTLTFNGPSTAQQTILNPSTSCPSGYLNSAGNTGPVVNISGAAASTVFTLPAGCEVYQNAISTSGGIIINGIMNQNGAWSSNDLTINGTLIRATNNTLAITGTLSNTGTLTQAASTTITVTDDYSNTGTISNLSTTTLTFNGPSTAQQTILNPSTSCPSGYLNSAGNTGPVVNISGAAASTVFTLPAGCEVYQSAISTSGAVVINGTMNQNGAWSSNYVTINGTLIRATNNTMNIGGTLTNTGTLTQAANTSIIVTDDYSNTGTISNLSSTTLTFNGPSTAQQTINNCSGNLNASDNTSPTIDYKGGAASTNLTIPANCTVYLTTNATNAGDITVNGTVYVMNAVKGDLLTVNNGGNFGFNGAAVTLNTKTLNSGSTVTFRGDGDGAADTYSINSFATTYYNLGIDSIDGSTDIFNLGATILVNTNLSVTSGILSLNGSNLTVTGTVSNDGTIRLQGGETVSATNDTNSGTVEYVGTSTYTELKFGDNYYNLTINGNGGAWGLDAVLDVNNNFSLTQGSLETNGNDITVGGNWSKSGTFTHENNTVIFDTAGTTSVISGSSTFNNFTSTTAGKAITFTNGTTQTIDGTLTLTGSAGNLITLRSTSTGNAWLLDANGTKNVSYVDVKDSDATPSSTSIVPTNSTNSGHVPNWDFNPSVTLSRNNATIAENGGTSTVTATLSGGTGLSVTVNVAYSGTGTITSDYTGAASCTIPAQSVSCTITLTGVNDTLDEAAETIVVDISSVTNGTESGTQQVQVDITDDDAAPTVAFNASTSNGSEATAAPTIAVDLSTASGQSVTVDYAVTGGTATSGGTDFTLASGTLTFNAGETSKNITLDVANDTLDENNETVVVAISNPTNSSLGVTTSHTYTINDNDNPPTVSFDAGTSSGGEDTAAPTLAVSLSTASGLSVTVDYAVTGGTATGGGTDFTLASGTLTFNAGETSKNITLSVEDDGNDESDETVIVDISNPSNATLGATTQHEYTITDDDSPAAGITVSAISGNTTEAGGTATFTVVLDGAPSDDVTIGISSDDTSEGTVSAASLTFTSANWDTPQTITVTGVNDDVDDGDINYNIVTAAATSNDGNYNTMNAANVAVTNTDNDTAAFTIGAISGHTTEAGGTATFTVKLATQPTDDVTIGISSDDTGEGTVSAASLTFTSVNWNSNQTITVTGVNDSIIDGDVAFNVVTAAATSNDTNYNNLNPANVAVTNDDNDSAGITVTQSGGTTVVTEAGGTDSFTVVLTAQPSDDVTIGISSDDTGEGTVSAASLTFTSANWNTPQTVTVTGVNDNIIDGNVNFNIITAAATSNDSNFDGVNAADVTATNNDNDTAGVSISAISGHTVEDGTTATFTAVLTAQPSSDVSFDLTSTDTGEGTVSPASLTFTNGNWNTPQTVTITGVDDLVSDGNQSFTITTSVTNSVDGIFDNLAVADVSVTNDDDESAPTFSVDDISINEGNSGTTTATFTITLSTASSDSVTVDYATSNGTATAGSDYTSGSGTLTFNAGETSKTVNFSVAGDTVDEVNETFNLGLSNGSVTISDDTGVATITDNDSATISLADETVGEGDDHAVVTVTLATTSDRQVTVDYATSNGTASSASDYVSASGTLTFDAGETSKTFNVTVNDDSTDEANETITVTLSNATNTTISDATGTITITDDDGSPSLSVNDVSVAENVMAGKATFTVTLGAASEQSVTVDYATSNGTATAGSDYTAASGTLTFDAGQTTKTFDVTISNDSVDEGNETYTVTLSNATNATISDATGTGTITNDDAATLSVADTTVGEEDGTATVTVSLSNASSQQVTVNYATSNGTATAGSDYTAASGTLTFEASETSKTFDITIADDSIDEANETITVTLSSPSGATISDATGTVTITDDDASPSLSINDVSVTENDVGGTATFTVTLSTASGRSVTVDYATANNTATAVSDYTAASGTLTFAAGETTKTIDVSFSDDGVNEANETFNVNLSNASNATISDSQGVGTINNDDTAPGLSVADVSAGESDGTVTVTVTLASAAGQQVTVDYATSNGTATAGSDYTAASGTLTFAAGETSKTFDISITSDTTDEPDENLVVTLSNATVASIADSTATVTITDDDAAPSLSIDDVSVGESGSASFTVTLSAASGKTVTVTYTTSNGTATSGSDYSTASGTLTFTAGQTTKNITVPILSDSIDENDETINVTISSATNASISDNQGVATITDDDNPPTVTLSRTPATIAEAGGISTVTATLSAVSGLNVTVDLAYSGTATENSDYTASSSSITINAGGTTGTATLTATDDGIVDAAETIDVDVDSVTNGTESGVQQVSVTITDDDSYALNITQSGGSTNVTEGTGSDTFTITLDSAPSNDVDITLTPGSDLAVDDATLTFTSGNWNVPQTVTVTAVDDALNEGAHTDTITYAISSADNNYDTLTGTAITANITDNDTPGVTITETSGSTSVTEGGSTDTYTIVLASQPTDDVTISLSSSAQVSRSSASVIFTSGNWNTPQTITLTAVDDSLAEGNSNVTLTHTVTSNDGGYDGISAASVSVAIVDNDSAGITVTQSGGTTGITEGSTTDTYTIVLTSEPTDDVTVTVTGTAQANVSASSLTFTNANWNTPRTVTVTAVNDDVAEGNHNATITHAASSSDTNYNGIIVSSVVAAITDNDSAGISITESGGSSAVTEGGATDTYTVVLTSQPTSTVTVTVNNTSQATTTPTVLTFTTGNWNTPQTVTITATNDNVAEGSHNTTLTHTSSSSDTNYNAITINDVVTSITDNDSAGVSVTQSGGTTTVTEGGATDSYSVVLTSQPTNTVTITLTHSAQITLSTETLTFGAGNWNTPQTVTVTAYNDSVAEGSLNTTITQTASSSDVNYNNISVGSVVTNITDNDSAGVSVTASGGTTVISESGTTDTYTVVLTSEPTSDVVVTVVSTSEANASVSSLTFTTGNWNTPQTVTVSAVDDSVEELDPNTTITHTVASSDTNYNGISANSILVEITNNDTHGITISESDAGTNVSEDGTTDTYTVVLNSRPLHDVTITPAVDSNLTVSPTTLTFTSANWNTPQTITVSAVNDDAIEGDHTSNITHTASSDDSQYDDASIETITVTISDNDVADDSPDASIIGHLTVGSGSTRTYTAADTTNTSYSWTITGDGAIVGNATSSSVEVLFSDNNGSVNLTLSVTKNSQSASSTVNIIVTKANIITTDSTLGRYDGVKATGATASGSLIINDAETVEGHGSVSVIDFDSFRFYGSSDAPLQYKIDTTNNVVFIGDSTANNNTGIVYRIPFASASGDIHAWDLPSYVKTREGQAEGDKFGYELVVFDDKIAIHAPGLRIIAVYSNNLTQFLSLVNEADNVPLGTNIFMQAEDFNGDSESELFVGGKYTSEDTSVVEESLGLSVTRAIELDIAMPEEGEVKAVEGQDEWESDVSLNEADATFNSEEQFYSSDVGDFNGDGINDLVVSSMNSCSAYVFFGTESIEGKSVENADVTINGLYCSGGLFGYQTVMGDVSGDNYEDIVISAPMGGSNSGGAVYVVFGFGSTSHQTIDLSDTSSGASITIESSQANGLLGAQTLALTDTNGDGVLDLMMSEETSEGTSTVIYALNRSATGSGEQGGGDTGNELSASGGCSLNNNQAAHPALWLIFIIPVVFLGTKRLRLFK
ncbi:hypothetical protein K1X76_00645 [bacterium]|nr:hypothetical protein [bacterium]